MASHVVVIDSTFRRAQIKTTPGKPLSEVLEEACSKFGFKASNYGLKNNNKPVDLSRSFRLSGLSSGAKLELVQLSKSAGVVSLALQLPPSEAQGTQNGRLVDKFPSTTTLWQVLRKFEAGVAGDGGLARNLTARGVPSTQSGEGRLYYEQPGLNVLNRELATLTDLQKTLAQLGLNSGSALIRLTFRTTDIPLEEAMVQIQQYFESVDGPTQPQSQPQPQSNHTPAPTPAAEPLQPTTSDQSIPPPSETSQLPPEGESIQQHAPVDETPEPLSPTISRPISVYRPPSSSTPSAALNTHNEADYTPTIEHAQVHQRLLNQSTRNTRLPTEAELAAQQATEAEKFAAIKDVEIKIRFPDQYSVTNKFNHDDTGKTLHSFVREECLDERFTQEPFILRNPGVKPGQKGDTIPDSDKKLIQQLHLKGRVLVIFGWDDGATATARGAKGVLKAQLRNVAEEFVVKEDTPSTGAPEEKGIRVNIGGKADDKDDSTGAGSAGGIGKKMPKWLKGMGKK